jgi:PAS domain S-box-containing protein
MDLTEKLRDMSLRYANTEELTDSDRYMILATLTTDSASSLTIEPGGGFTRDWLADNLSPILGFDMTQVDSFEKWSQIIHPDDREQFWNSVKKITGGLPVYGELRIITADKKIVWVSNTVYPLKDKEGRIVRLISAVKNITDRKIFENEMHKSQRLESLGLLAGGIAHDFNNIMSATLGNITIAQNMIKGDEAINLNLQAAAASIDKAKLLTKQLLVFARGGIPKITVIEIVKLVKECTLLALTGSGITVEFIPDEAEYNVRGDSGQLMQIFQNLTMNAARAMEDKGVLRIEFTTRVVDENDKVLSGGLYVSIKIIDRGHGIPAEILDKIFDPFFTTRESGTGLGLTVAHSVIRKHQGIITAESIPGEGSVFEVLLPVYSGEASRADELSAELMTGSGSILIMDDQPDILRTLSAMLEILGYSSKSASGGDEALTFYETAFKKHKPYDAVILDLTVPGGMGGMECARRIRAVDKNANIVFSSGYSSDDIDFGEGLNSVIHVLEKPYDIKELGRVISDLFNKTV